MDTAITELKITRWQLGNFAVASIGGTLLHFLYDITGQSLFTAPFSGVNESTWEHMKLLFFPLFLFSLIQSRYFKELKSYWCIKLLGILVGLTMIPILFYTYNGALGKSPDFVNITIFFISTAVSSLVENYLLKRSLLIYEESGGKKQSFCKFPALAFLAICAIGFLFIIFTFSPPEIPLFQDPTDGSFGI